MVNSNLRRREEVAPKVLGVPNSVYKSYGTEDEAFVAYGKAKMTGLTKVVGAGSIESSNSTSSGTTDSSGSVSSLSRRPSGSNPVVVVSREAPAPSSSRRTTSRAQDSAIPLRENRLKQVKEERLPSNGDPSSPSSARHSADDRSEVAPTKSRKGKERAVLDDVFSGANGSPSSVSRSQGRVESRKGKAVAHEPSESVMSTPSHSPARRQAAALDRERSHTSPSRTFRKARPDSAVTNGAKQITEVDEDALISQWSPVTGVTYCSDRSDIEDERSPPQSPSRSSGLPAPVNDPGISSSFSPLVPISQGPSGQPSSPPFRQHTNHAQTPHLPHQHHGSTPPAQYCQCDVCPTCHNPRFTQIIYLTTCQSAPNQPIYLYANPQQHHAPPNAPLYPVCDPVNESISQAPHSPPHGVPGPSMQETHPAYSVVPIAGGQLPTSPPRGVPVPYMQPAHATNVVYDTAHDPRSPVSRRTGVPRQAGRYVYFISMTAFR